MPNNKIFEAILMLFPFYHLTLVSIFLKSAPVGKVLKQHDRIIRHHQKQHLPIRCRADSIKNACGNKFTYTVAKEPVSEEKEKPIIWCLLGKQTFHALGKMI